MVARFRRAAFLFRRDLRLDDNRGLARAAAAAGEVVPCFVFDPRQGRDANAYFSAPAFGFLLASLGDLDEQLAAAGGRLFRFEGRPDEVVERLIAEAGVEAVFANRDYTPFSRQRDDEIAAVCAASGVPFETVADALLTEPEEVLTGHGTSYQVFTPFWRAARERPVAAPKRLAGARFSRARIAFAVPRSRDRERLAGARSNPAHPGGRARGLALLAGVYRLGDYAERRDLPAEDDTSALSPHHKFGTVSIRETFRAIARAFGPDAELLRQLYWRDFFTHLAFHHPRVFGEPFRREVAGVAWDDDEERFTAWCEGRTGFPLVDAGMRQLAATGWMHNRVRMVAASLLVKDLHLDWRRGERHFARHLVDYDPAVNNGNWQWVASTGADAQPYFRIFNPWTQQRRFDPDAAYVRRWVPELATFDAEEIHRLDRRRPPGLSGYPLPLVDHRKESVEAQRRFERARKSAR
jgi:deoxyribodipyrimidine photo-lyase